MNELYFKSEKKSRKKEQDENVYYNCDIVRKDDYVIESVVIEVYIEMKPFGNSSLFPKEEIIRIP